MPPRSAVLDSLWSDEATAARPKRAAAAAEQETNAST